MVLRPHGVEDTAHVIHVRDRGLQRKVDVEVLAV